MRNGKYQLSDFPVIMSDAEWDEQIAEWDKILGRNHRPFNRKSTESNGFPHRYDDCIQVFLEILQEGFDAAEAANAEPVAPDAIPEEVGEAVADEAVINDATLERLKICISICESGVTDTQLKLWNTDARCLANRLKQVKVGKKNGAYFVRYGNGTIRNDKAAPDEAGVLILDGDSSISDDGEIVSGAPDPCLVHELLASHKVRHIIYSSYSNGEHGDSYFKYRVLIFIKYTRQQLPVLLDHFHELLNSNGVMLFNVRENRVWSQPWFFPRCSEERKHLFKFYEFLDGNEQDAAAICTAYEAAHPTIAPEPVYQPKPVKRDYYGLEISAIDAFNEHWKSPVYYLQSRGYRCYGNRWLPPHCRNDLIPGVQVCRNCCDGVERIYSHHSNDQLCDGHPHDSFDCFKILEHNGDEKAALIAVGRGIMIEGMTLEQWNRREHAKRLPSKPINWAALEVA